MAKILDGKVVAQKIKDEVKEYVADCPNKISLTIVQVGDNPASNTYVKNKCKACEDVGIASSVNKLQEGIGQEVLKTEIDFENYLTNGLMLQLPLPSELDERKLLDCIDPEVDSDCLTTRSLGEFYSSNNPNIAPCTAQGIIDLLDYYDISIEGKHAVVVGRSNIVGKPIAHLLTCRNATVTVCHSKTPNLSEFTKQADILVVAIGKSKYITADMVKPRAIVIDVGINRDENGKLCGDVDFEQVKSVASAITPVPGGIGPMTVAELLKNTVKLHTIQNN